MNGCVSYPKYQLRPACSCLLHAPWKCALPLVSVFSLLFCPVKYSQCTNSRISQPSLCVVAISHRKSGVGACGGFSATTMSASRKIHCTLCGGHRNASDVSSRRTVCWYCRKKRPRQPGGNRRLPLPALATAMPAALLPSNRALQLVNMSQAPPQCERKEQQYNDDNKVESDGKRSGIIVISS